MKRIEISGHLAVVDRNFQPNLRPRQTYDDFRAGDAPAFPLSDMSRHRRRN